MGRLNRDINKETAAIAKAASELLAVLPSLVGRISSLRSMSLRFTTDGTVQAGEVARAVNDLRERSQRVGLNSDQRAMEVSLAAEDAARRLDCHEAFERCFEHLNGVLERIEGGEWQGGSSSEGKR